LIFYIILAHFHCSYFQKLIHLNVIPFPNDSNDIGLPMTNLLRILIVDDEAPARHRLRELLADCAVTLPLEVAGEATNGRETLAFVEQRQVDVVLLDIRMPGMDGLETAEHLLKLPHPPAVIFTTAFDAYAIQAFEVNAIDYLLKPVRVERLLAALRKAATVSPPRPGVLRNATVQPRRHFSMTERGKVVLIPVADIFYLRADLKYVAARTAQREYLLDESLSQLEQELEDRFVRIHRNCLVARDRIAGFEKDGEGGWTARLRGIEDRLPVSRRQQHIVKELGR
jgi:two-component system, LytTR family, response regulator AlgR